jgi:spoIIIJ-associated protein
MDDKLEVSGKTVDEAVEQALLQLGLSRDDVEVEVLSAGSRGRFGLGGEPARVAVRPRDGGASADGGSAGITEAGDDDEQPPSAEAFEEDEGGEADQEAPVYDAEAVARAEEILRELLRLIDIEAEVEAREPETPGDGLGRALAVLDVEGEDLGLLIGRRGETLAALQYMVNLLLNHGAQGRLSVTIDVEQYRQRREQRLVSMARRAAEEARETGETIFLEPMPPAERRIIHIALADDDRVMTRSEGGGPSRRVAVSARRSRSG